MNTNAFVERATLWDKLRSFLPVALPERTSIDLLRDVLGSHLVDLRHLADADGRGKEHGRFSPSGACLHQTAFAWSDAAPNERYVEIPAHFVIRRDGRVLFLHDLRALMHHGDWLNRRSFGIEIECREYGSGAAFWRSKKELAAGRTKATLHRPVQPIQLERVRQVIEFAEFDLQRPLSIWGHRQGHASRTTDPGSVIYRSLGWAGDRLRPDDHFGTGKSAGTPIPLDWRPAA